METYQMSCDAVNTAVGYLRTMRVADVRQTFDFLGVHHTEVIVGVGMFILMQLTKFTGVLLIAIAIAFVIFYMCDTHFPELNQRRSDRGSIVRPYLEIFKPQYQDARTSARLPPFANTSSNNSEHEFFGGNQIVSKDGRVYNPISSSHAAPINNSNLLIVRSNAVPTQGSGRSPGISGMSTPLGHLGYPSGRRSKNNAGLNQQHNKESRSEDRASYRRSANNEYDHTARRNSEHRSNRSSGIYQYQDENRSRRPTGFSKHDEGRPTKNRRSSKDRSSSAKRQIANDFNDHARGYERRAYTTPAGPSANLNRFGVTSGGNSPQYTNNRSNLERTSKSSRSPNYSGNNSPNRSRQSRRNTNQ